MKLLVIAAVIAVSGAGRLEQLERSYLPPDNSIQVRSGRYESFGSFGANSGGFSGGSAGQPGFNSLASYSPPSNQYLPAKAGSNGAHQFGGLQGFSAHNGFQRSLPIPNFVPSTAQRVSHNSNSFGDQAKSKSHFGTISTQYLSPNANADGQSGATSRQYHVPDADSLQNDGQQQFGYYGSELQQQFAAVNRRAIGQQNIARFQNNEFQNRGFQSAGPKSAAASRQYLAPNVHGSQNTDQQQSAVFQNGEQIEAMNRQYLAPRSRVPQFGARFRSQQSPASRQYLTPHRSLSQPQQPFDDKTGYQY